MGNRVLVGEGNKSRVLLNIFIVIISLVVWFFTLQGVSAKENILFTVKPVLPSNQDNGVENYISITSEGGVKQTLEFDIINNTGEEREVEVSIVNAYTSPNGIIQYKEDETTNSSILGEASEARSYIEGDNIYTVPTGVSKRVEVEVNIPSYEGVLMGGVSFKVLEEDKEDTGGQNFKIDNEINYVIATIFTFKEDIEITESSLEFDTPYIDTMPAYYVVRLPTTYGELKPKRFDIEYEVQHKGDTLFANKKKFVFAPNTKVNIPFTWEHEKIKKGETYRIKGFFEYKNEGEVTGKIPFDFEFTHTGEDAENITNMFTTPIEEGSLMWLLLLLVVPIVIIYYMLRGRSEYVLETDEVPPATITKDNPMYEQMKRKKDVVGENVHVYVRRKHKRTGDFYYTFKRSK